MNTTPKTVEIDLITLINAILRKVWLVVLCIIIGAGGGFCYAYFGIVPTYTSSAYFYVNNSSLSLSDTKLSVSGSDLSASRSLIDTYSVILKTRTTLKQVIEKADLPYSYNELKEKISAGSVNDTEVFDVAVTSTSPQEAELIANTIAEVLPDTISQIVEGSSVRIVDYAVVPGQKTGPNLTRYTLIGLLLGFAGSCAFIIIQQLMDDRIPDEDYLIERFTIPLLGVIPDIEVHTRHRYGKYANYGYGKYGYGYRNSRYYGYGYGNSSAPDAAAKGGKKNG